MYRSILVPLDGSTFGEHALPLALSLARRAGAALRLLHVHTPLGAVYAEGSPFLDDSMETQMQRHAQAYLESVEKRLKTVSPVPVTSSLLEGAIAPTISEAAAGGGSDLVVMTTHGRGSFRRFWLGSVADELVRDLSVPLLLVHPAEGPPNLAAEPALKHLLVPLDGSPLAEQMIEPAMALGSLTGADYTLLRVIKPVLPVTAPLPPGTFGTMAQAMMDRMEEAHVHLKRQASTYLEGVAERLRARSLRVQTLVTIHESPAVAILEHAVPPGTDLVALATHGRRGLTRLFLGSVADKVLRGGTVPVLVMRPAVA
jgi:nucleotide-binding universal stress UspA family protein